MSSLGFILIKLLNRIPHPVLVKFGYSKIGSKIVNVVKKSQSKTVHETPYGVKIYLDLANPSTWDLIQGKDPEKKVKEFFLENIKTGDTIIDVGANIGEFSLIAAEKVGPSGKIVAIEPLFETVTSLKENLELNGFQNFTILECAVGSKSSKMTLYKKNINATLGMLDPITGEDNMVKSTKINVETIDNIISSEKIDKVRMLKIDVEGYEYEVLLGCQDSFRQNKIDNILCEIHKKYLEKKGIKENIIYSFLKENGFSINFINKDDDRLHILATHL